MVERGSLSLVAHGACVVSARHVRRSNQILLKRNTRKWSSAIRGSEERKKRSEKHSVERAGWPPDVRCRIITTEVTAPSIAIADGEQLGPRVFKIADELLMFINASRFICGTDWSRALAIHERRPKA